MATKESPSPSRTFFYVSMAFCMDVEPFAAHKFIAQSIGRKEFRVHQIRDWLSANVKPLYDAFFADYFNVRSPAPTWA